MPVTTLRDAVLHGLKPSLKIHVVQQKFDTIENLVRAARLAEAVLPPPTDNLSALMVDALAASTKSSQRQAAEIRNLTTKIAALTSSSPSSQDDEELRDINGIGGSASAPIGNSATRSGNPEQYRPQQTTYPPRVNYTRQTWHNQGPPQQPQQLRGGMEFRNQRYERSETYRQGGGGQHPQTNVAQQMPYRPFRQINTSIGERRGMALGPGCDRCGRHHADGRCRATDQPCRQCGKYGHFARVCRSGRNPNQ